MDLTSQTTGRTALNSTKRRRTEDLIQTSRLLQAPRLPRTNRWKSTNMMSNRQESYNGVRETGQLIFLDSPVEKIDRQEAAVEELRGEHMTERENPCSEGLKKKPRCSSLGSQLPVGSAELVDEKSLKFPSPSADEVDPDTFLISLVQAQSGKTLKVKAALELQEFFPEITDAQVAAYNTQIVAACRNGEVETLKSLWKDGHSLECCNRFGESLLHMACRRGFLEVVQFLLEEVGLAVCIRDDCGRTPLHDACWNAQPQQRICEMLLERDPRLLLIADKRGHTPFQYAREHDWPLWRNMLFDRREQLQCLANEETVKRFS